MNAKLTQDELQAIKERAEKAPAGPWTFGEGYEQMEPGYYFADVKGYITLADEEGTVKPETIDFIVNAQQDVTKLLSEIERMQTQEHFAEYAIRQNKALWEALSKACATLGADTIDYYEEEGGI